MRFCVVIQENHWNSSISKGAADTVELLTINTRLNRLSLLQKLPKNRSTSIPPHAQHGFLCPKVLSGRLTGLLTRRSPFSMAFIVHKRDPFLVTRHNILEKRRPAMSSKQPGRNFHSFPFLGFCELFWNPSTSEPLFA